jgi:UDP:flavonoid glycosyltransferase YjiC (YdhE family)
MATVLVAAMPFAGHVNPVAALSAALVGRGHDVVAYTGRKYAQRFEEAGARVWLWSEAPDFDDLAIGETFPAIGRGRGLRAIVANMRELFIGTAAAQAHDVARLASDVRPDAVVADCLCLGPGLWAEREGVPWAGVSLVPLSAHNPWGPPAGSPFLPARSRPAALRNRVLAAAMSAGPGEAVRGLVNRQRSALGLGPTRRPGLDSAYSERLTIAQGIPELEYPRPEPVPGVELIGQLVPPSAGPLPAWWGRWPAGAPLVHVTQGTLNVDPTELLLPALAGLTRGAEAAMGRRPVVVLATGGGVGLGDMPADAFATDFLPYARILEDLDAVVSNGGYGTVLAALGAGVPLVIAGSAIDKPDSARRVAWAGAGIDLRTGRPTPSQVRDAVARVLGDPAYRRRARELGASMLAAGGTARSVDLIETRLLGV